MAKSFELYMKTVKRLTIKQTRPRDLAYKWTGALWYLSYFYYYKSHQSNFVFALGCLCKCMRNKLRLAAILFLCHANLPRFDARIWPHFHVKTHKSPLFNAQIGMSTALFNLWLLLLVITLILIFGLAL